MDIKCLKCDSSKYYVKTVVFPQKDSGLKIHLGTYYLKTCAECGFTEMYEAAIVDKEKEEKPEPIPEY
ncbi:MAG: hypothetical protein ACRC6K_05185 [Fusobacteriaceae bacterium]